MQLRAVMLAAAGLASRAYLAFRPRTSQDLTRELDLASLDRQVGNWLPKLPYARYIRLEIADTAEYLQLSGSGETVDLALPGTTDRQRELRARFRETCAAHDLPVHESPEASGTLCLRCTVPADRDVVARVLEALLRNVFDVDFETKLIAAIPR